MPAGILCHPAPVWWLGSRLTIGSPSGIRKPESPLRIGSGHRRLPWLPEQPCEALAIGVNFQRPATIECVVIRQGGEW